MDYGLSDQDEMQASLRCVVSLVKKMVVFLPDLHECYSMARVLDKVKRI